ncbi:MAG TPA: hypothetical protein VHB27_23675 [Rhodopila sp.]|uniref:hypothetical protein n=1 Tax=Rhodopila sp. TaxID=2480087 RepID=UPI002BF14A2A|nr:hypothetical protein [Rhodopila sp.]HVY18239.1 hypothetical protein [Rhodopila sp.]
MDEAIEALTALNSYLLAVEFLESRRTETTRGLLDIIIRCQNQQRRAGIALRELSRIIAKNGAKKERPA